MQDKGRLVRLTEVSDQGDGRIEGCERLLGGGLAAGHQGGDAGPGGGRQSLGRILDCQHLVWAEAEGVQGPLVGLGIGLLVRHILATDQEGQPGAQLRQQLLQQGLHRLPAAGGDNRLDQACSRRFCQQAGHARAQPQLSGQHQLAIVALLSPLQGRNPAGIRLGALHLQGVMAHAFLAATDRQQAPVGIGVPLPGQASLGKGPVEGKAMALKLRFSQGAIHIPEQGSRQAIARQCGHWTRLKLGPGRHGCSSSPSRDKDAESGGVQPWAGGPWPRTMGAYRTPPLAPLPTEPRWQLPAPLFSEPRSPALPEQPSAKQQAKGPGTKAKRAKSKQASGAHDTSSPTQQQGPTPSKAEAAEGQPSQAIEVTTKPAETATAPRANGFGLPAPLLAVLQRRGLTSPEAIAALLDPPKAPNPSDHFADLAKAVGRLRQACQAAERVAICGDYDADGMTSTALLVGVLKRLGARPQAAIPSRQEDGYGLNAAMVERLHGEGVGLLVTVDNGIAAREALLRAQALGLDVILTDHHSLPDELPPFLALLHPACTPPDSPYKGLAGVGLAYVLGQALAEALGDQQGLANARDLFCIGTIADMAPLTGVNRRWLMDGLPGLKGSGLPGLQALQQVAGLDDSPIDAGSVGFQLAPRINAVGRLGDPQLVVDLLTTADQAEALELARACEGFNRQRRELCEAIEAEAVALVEADGDQQSPFLLLAQTHWHHGVIGIVASRLVERFSRPVALLASEGDGRLRASVRAPAGFAADQALKHCHDLLLRYGGHPAAGGFTVLAERVAELHERLNGLAAAWLERRGEGAIVEPEALLPLEQIDRNFWQQLQRLEPFGSAMPTPLFWSNSCEVLEQRELRGGHLQLTLAQGEGRCRAIAWRWQGPKQQPARVDVAFRLRNNRWQGEERLQLEVVALRASGAEEICLQRRQRLYWCRRHGDGVLIRNAAGEELLGRPLVRTASVPGQSVDLAPCPDHPQANHPYLRSLVQDAAMALGLAA